jgi:plastocyanin
MRIFLSTLLAGFTFAASALPQSPAPVSGSVAVQSPGPRPELGDVAIWLTPAGGRSDTPAPRAGHFRMLQKNKRFTPPVLIVPVGSDVDFPNADPFFHNVFSLHDGKRFDLGLYEAGASRRVTFTKLGVCFVFCNIHPEMGAVVVVVDTAYSGVSGADGSVSIPDVPAGLYTMSAWSQRYRLADQFPREVTITDANRSLGNIRLVDDGKPIGQHKNKYGRDYTPAKPASPVYKP